MNFWERRSIVKNLIGAGLLLLLWGAITAMFWWAIMDTTRWIIYAGLLVATIAIVRLYDRMPAAWAGIGLHRWTLRELGFGAAIGFGMALIAWAFLVGNGHLQWNGTGPIGTYLYLSLIIVANAVGEELLFRGYLFQRGIEIMGTVTATILGSLLFALAHWFNPALSGLAILNIFLAGLFFSLCYLRTGSLWLPMAAHAAWNLILAKVFGASVSGLDFGASLLWTNEAGPRWLTGGSFGPEGGLAATVALAAGTVALLKIPTISFSPYVHAKVFRAFHRRQVEIMESQRNPG